MRTLSVESAKRLISNSAFESRKQVKHNPVRQSQCTAQQAGLYPGPRYRLSPLGAAEGRIVRAGTFGEDRNSQVPSGPPHCVAQFSPMSWAYLSDRLVLKSSMS